MKKNIYGLSGYIGSGKTLAASYLESVGFLYISADEVINKIYEPGGEGYKKIYNFFGEEFILKCGNINRKKLAKFVFSDVNKLKILNGLIHPIVTRKIKNLLRDSSSSFIVVEAVYLDYRNLGGLVDKIVWIDSSEDKIMHRNAHSKFYDTEMLGQILSIQREIGIKPERIDYIIDNNGSVGDLYEQLDGIAGVKSC